MSTNQDSEVERLTYQVRHLETLLTDRDQEIRHLRSDLEARDSIIKVRDIEITELAAVIARNLTRIQAETAVAAEKIAKATTPRRLVETET